MLVLNVVFFESFMSHGDDKTESWNANVTTSKTDYVIPGGVTGFSEIRVVHVSRGCREAQGHQRDCSQDEVRQTLGATRFPRRGVNTHVRTVHFSQNALPCLLR